ncbi:hypothetical protein [Chelativorans sp. Marseille-P2723]|uniref:hypothetical protein n=1 Tax=Chelativorans sp. Marseille-P2723 TaxID=2709133 RepID=UPI00157090D5|nr:hypothetical protein [Chelativorans sp. Marseille-P2723]
MDSRFEGASRTRDGWPSLGHAGMGLLRIALLFGSAAVALALVLTPILERASQDDVAVGAGIDSLATGSVANRRGQIFTIRRSVLQPAPEAVCIIDSTGRHSGSC